LAFKSDGRLPSLSDFGAHHLGDNNNTLRSAGRSWTATFVAYSQENGRLSKYQSIIDTDRSGHRLILLHDYLRLAEESADRQKIKLYDHPNIALFYDAFLIQRDKRDLILHPSKVFVQKVLSRSGWGMFNPQTYAPDRSINESTKLSRNRHSYFMRDARATNQPVQIDVDADSDCLIIYAKRVSITVDKSGVVVVPPRKRFRASASQQPAI
jgi:hypothetical protein